MKNRTTYQEYEEFLAKKRTAFSLQRTMLSTERTFLSYIRTAFTIFLFGVAVMRLFELNKVALATGVVSIILGMAILLIGLERSIKKTREIKRLKKRL